MEDIWGTNDIACAAFLVLCGEEVVGVRWFKDERNPRNATCFFLFRDQWSVHECFRMFMSDEGRVNALKFTRTYATLKRRMKQTNLPPRSRKPYVAAS